MIIRTESWHYRLLDFFDAPHTSNLCTYFWTVVFFVMLTPLLVIFAVGMAVAATMPLWPWFSGDYLLPSVLLIGGAEIGVLTVLLAQVIKARHLVEIGRGERDVPTDSLLGAWLTAKHQKICPRLTFGSDE